MNSENTPHPGHSHWVHRVLLTGVAASCALLTVGLAIVLFRNEARPMGPPPPLSDVFSKALHGRGLSFLELGLIVLMLTPVARVAVLVLGWAADRDWKFAAIAFFVLLLLGASLFLGVG